MRLLSLLPFVKVLTLLLLPHILLGQDQGQSGGGESAAESSVTTSSSKKSAAAPETIESNPVVTVVKSGLPIQTAISIPVDEMVQVAEAGGSLTNLKTTATTIVNLKAQGKDPAAVIKSAVKAINKGIKFTSNAGQGFLDVAVSLVDGKINENELADVKSNLESGVDLTVQEVAGVSYIKIEVAKGTSAVTINSKLKGKSADAIKKSKEELTVIGDLVKQGISEEDATTLAASGGDASMADFIKEVYAINDSDELKETLAQLFAYKDSDGKLFYSTESEQLAFKSAFTVLSQFLNNFNVNSESDLPLEISYSSLTDPDNPYIKELIKLFVVYGALGDSAEKIISDIGFDESGGMDNLFSYSETAASTLKNGTATSDFFNFLRVVTDSDIGDPDNDNDSFLDVSKNSVINIARDDITFSAGNSISIGSTSSSTEIDVSSKLPPAKNNNSANTSDPDRKIYAIIGAKDLVIKGDVTFKNSNDVEDHALALGSGGDLSFRSEISSGNPDYDSPDPINLAYTGSNLGLGSDDSMYLVNVNISTGGNLAIGSLSDLEIGLKDGHESTFSVGTGGENSDPDNVYLYANNLLSINGLKFAENARVDDVYMDAIRIDLKNVTFPGTSEVMARSRDGTINAGAGSVNFLGNVKHGSDLITGAKGLATNEFNGKDGHWDLNKKLDNGKSAFVIRKR